MNIFALHRSNFLCARWLDNKRVVKMTLETAQLLSTVMYLREASGPYRPTHQSHPCVKWVNAHDAHIRWTTGLFYELSMEYRRRFGREHKSFTHHMAKFFNFTMRYPSRHYPHIWPRSHGEALCMPAHKAYRAYLNKKWENDLSAPRWTGTHPPFWASPSATRYQGVES